jgi:hypothetical protein
MSEFKTVYVQLKNPKGLSNRIELKTRVEIPANGVVLLVTDSINEKTGSEDVTLKGNGIIRSHNREWFKKNFSEYINKKGNVLAVPLIEQTPEEFLAEFEEFDAPF